MVARVTALGAGPPAARPPEERSIATGHRRDDDLGPLVGKPLERQRVPARPPLEIGVAGGGEHLGGIGTTISTMIVRIPTGSATEGVRNERQVTTRTP